MTDEETPPCFGLLEIVFPMAEDGLRQSPESCMACRHKTECLRAAMKSRGGLEMQEDKVDKAYASGRLGFMERWSKKKEIQRKMKDSEKKKP